MGFKEILEKASRKRKEKKERFRQMLEQEQLEKMVLERSKSSNQRELERYMEEDKQKEIKEYLEVARKKRSDDINFGHNPIDAKNIITATKWHVLKEKNQFAKKGNMFTNQPNIHKTSSNLMNNGNVLHGKNMFQHKGGGFI
jgi:hypothetical protein